MNFRPRLARLLPGVLAVALLAPPAVRGESPAAQLPGQSIPAALAQGSRATGFWSGAWFPMRATVGPSPARLGQQLTYRAFVLVAGRERVRFGPPEPGGEFTWGPPRAGRASLLVVPDAPHGGRADSIWLEVPLQVFATGLVAIPGPAVTITSQAGGRPVQSRLPTVHLLVMPVITAADSNATLRPVHGPLGAPWWERVSWVVVAIAVVLLALLVWLVVWMRRRRRRPLAAPSVPRVPVAARDPSAEALAALARLRAEKLAEQERFGEHSLGLTRILRRYLEATLTTPRPGDTSGELVARVRSAGLAAEDVQRLEGLLGLWDRVKFARAPLSLPEALRCESAVEQLVRRREPPREVA